MKTFAIFLAAVILIAACSKKDNNSLQKVCSLEATVISTGDVNRKPVLRFEDTAVLKQLYGYSFSDRYVDHLPSHLNVLNKNLLVCIRELKDTERILCAPPGPAPCVSNVPIVSAKERGQ
jgi:hypothetical protein